MKNEMRKGGGGPGGPERRPYLASECTDLPAAEKWRREILREVTKKVAEIQNGGRGGAVGRRGSAACVRAYFRAPACCSAVRHGARDRDAPRLRSPVRAPCRHTPPRRPLTPCAAGLGESRVRDLNDEINKLLREKGHWERQIKASGRGGAGRVAWEVGSGGAPASRASTRLPTTHHPRGRRWAAPTTGCPRPSCWTATGGSSLGREATATLAPPRTCRA